MLWTAVLVSSVQQVVSDVVHVDMAELFAYRTILFISCCKVRYGSDCLVTKYGTVRYGSDCLVAKYGTVRYGSKYGSKYSCFLSSFTYIFIGYAGASSSPYSMASCGLWRATAFTAPSHPVNEVALLELVDFW